MSKFNNLEGLKFGKLTANKVVGKDTQGKLMWECECECGNTTKVSRSNLTRKDGTKSCGCLRFENSHNLSNSKFYQSWLDMKKRCDDVNNKGYENYGGRGIKYSVEWVDFEGFVVDMFDSYVDGLTLERNDVNGDYCKENCSWVSKKDQAKNKRKYANNTVGLCCVSRLLNKGIPSLRARVQNPLTGKRVSKQLSLNTYSEEYALKVLHEWVKEMHILFEYGDNHGS